MKKLLSVFVTAALTAVTVMGTTTFASAADNAGSLQINMNCWQYEESKDVYWQVGVQYCSNPADLSYETLGIYVPGEYFTAVPNGDGTYTCEINPEGAKGEYTIETAPLVIPVNTAGYSAQSAPTKFTNEAGTFAQEGIIYVYPGCRGRDSGAPTGVTDLKAAIRYIRSNDELLPGDSEKIYAFGHSGGGAQTAILGASGNSEEYNIYLEAIGAVMDESDSIYGAMCWCPITALDFADEAYEWTMGLAREDLIPEMQTASEKLAARYAEYINELGLTDKEGNVLTLEASEEGYWQAGSYYEYITGIVESSINDFLSVTEFPYTASSVSSGPGGGGMPTAISSAANNGSEVSAEGDSDGEPAGDSEDASSGDSEGEAAGDSTGEQTGDSAGEPAGGSGDSQGGASVEYATVEDYIQSLNEKENWVEYDAASNTVKVLSLKGFAITEKNPTKDVGAFDTFDLSSAENTLFGEGNGAEHFDTFMAEALEGTEYAEQFAVDLERTDALGTSLAKRIEIYNPMYYISDYYSGAGSTDIAPYWRIRSGIAQGDTSITVEINLAAALQQIGIDVDFATIWHKGHETAELTGSSTSNFIEWIKSHS